MTDFSSPRRGRYHTPSDLRGLGRSLLIAIIVGPCASLLGCTAQGIEASVDDEMMDSGLFAHSGAGGQYPSVSNYSAVGAGANTGSAGGASSGRAGSGAASANTDGAGSGAAGSNTGQASGAGGSNAGRAGSGAGGSNTGRAGSGAGGSNAGRAGSGAGGSNTGRAGSGAGGSNAGRAGSGAGGSASGRAGSGAGGSSSVAGGAGVGPARGGSGNAGAPGGGPTLMELALGKPATASTQQATHETPQGNDGSLTTRWCAKDGTFPQWWRVDLGDDHTLHDFTISWEHPDRAYTFKVETSSDDATYTERSSLSNTGVAQAVLFPSNVSARYVRVTVTAAAPSAPTSNGTIYPTWACFFEISINGL